MKPQVFASVRKSLQVRVFFLFSHRVCSPLFVWVGVSVGVTFTCTNGANDLFSHDLLP